MFLSPTLLRAQESTEKEKPNQLDILKINVGQIAVNEVRLLYELELRKRLSLEFGTGYIYPHRRWFDQGGSPMLASGFGAYLGIRRYTDKRRVIYQPVFRSYIQLMAFFRRSSFENEWFFFPGSMPSDSECANQDEDINQLGGVVRFGWQTSRGRVAVDFYGGLGFKYMTQRIHTNIQNSGTDVCEIIPASTFPDRVANFEDVLVVFNAGVKIGIRRNNRERNYPSQFVNPDDVSGDKPPKF